MVEIIHKKALVPIQFEQDIVTARAMGRTFSKDLCFDSINQARIVTAISELARNIYKYAGTGQICFEQIEKGNRHGLKITASDQGPGIREISKAMEPGYSTSGSLGVGIPGIKNMMDEFYITSSPGSGTKVTVFKWQ